jgi:ribosome-associated protein
MTLQRNTPQQLSPAVSKALNESLHTTEEVVYACQDAKARNIKILDVSGTFDLADYFVIVSGRSDRHVQGICNRILLNLKEMNVEPLAVEGFDEGHWILMDCGDVIIHVFYEQLRSHYDIEGLWLEAKPVDVPERDDSDRRAA